MLTSYWRTFLLTVNPRDLIIIIIRNVHEIIRKKWLVYQIVSYIYQKHYF